MRARLFWLALAVNCTQCGTAEPDPVEEIQEFESAYLDFSTQDNNFGLACFHVATPITDGYQSRKEFCLARLQGADESAAALKHRADVGSDFYADPLIDELDGYSEALGVIAARILRGDFKFEGSTSNNNSAVPAAWEESLARFDGLLSDLAERRIRVHQKSAALSGELALYLENH